jgi:hypothetical protein
MKNMKVADIYDFVCNEVHSKTDVAVALDSHLNYLCLNQRACEQLQREESELLGKNIVESFPSMIASRNHRNLLKAVSGMTIKDEVVEGATGHRYLASYEPLIIEGKVNAIIVTAIVL